MQPEQTDPKSARQRVERVFQEQGWDNVEDIDDWGGEELEALRSMLSEEQYEALLDALSEGGAHDY